MDTIVLKKRLSSFKSEKGTLSRVSDELLVDILTSWEQWTGTAKDFYSELGITKMQLGGLMQKAKKLRREGRFQESDFKEIEVADESVPSSLSSIPSAIELVWDNNKVIRFGDANLLLDFLKKAA